MIYNKMVTFYDDSKEQDDYNPRTQSYGSRKELACIFANITDLSANRQMTILGALDDTSKTIRLVKAPPKDWQILTIEGDKTVYRRKSKLNTSKGYSIIVGEDHG